MGLLGALVGGGLGLLLGGPLGAVLGGVLGASVADPSIDHWRQGTTRGRIVGRCPNCQAVISFAPGAAMTCPRCGVRLGPAPRPGPGQGRAYDSTRGAAQARAQSAFMVALICLSAKVAKADGHVSSAEVQAFDSFLRHELGMPAAERRLAARIFNQARDSDVPARDYARQLRTILPGQPNRMRDLISLLLKIAWADGKLDPAEETLIRSIAGDLGLSSRDYEEAKALFSRGNLSAAYAVLGLEASASVEDIKKNYRRLAREYHPDTLAAKGLPEDFTKFATEKLQAINDAYTQIRQARGF
jgi:DnaJ like chaperone protein